MLEVCPLLECLKVNDFALVRSAEFEIVASFVWTLFEHSLERVGNAHRIAPVGCCLQEWFFLAHDLARVVSNRMIEVWLVHFNCDTSSLLQAQIEQTVFVDADVGPGAISLLTRPIDDDTLAVGKPLICADVMWRV